MGEFRGDPGDPGLHVRPHLGEVLAQGLGEHLRLNGKCGQKKRCDDHRRTKFPRFGFATASRLDGDYSLRPWSRVSWSSPRVLVRS
jgi:hypothetical protein